MAKTIDDFKKDWQAAYEAGDQKAMDAAHAGAEAIRAEQGYSGGADGSQYIKLDNNTSSNKTTTATKPSNFTGSATGVNTYNDDQASIIAKMNANSQAWFGADEATQKALHEENQRLAEMLGGSVSFNSASGYWSGSAEKPQQMQTYDSKYSSQIDALLNAILNREEFSYDYTTDPSYLAYEQQYKRLGDRAREDTLGDIAGLTGGYASSWAASAASQAQNDYNQQLSGIIPTLYDAAYNRYMDDYNTDVSNLSLLMGLDDTYYGRYRDTVGDSQWQQQFDYNAGRDEVADNQWQQTFDWNKTVDDFNMKAQEQTTKFNQMMDRWNMTGVADSEVAAYLGIPEGTTTESYYFNKASLALDQAKFAESKKESSKVEAETNQLEDSIARNAKKRIDGTESYQAGAEYILTAVTSADEYYRVGAKAGIPTSILQEAFDAYYSEALKPEASEGERDYTYYAMQMGQAADPVAWYEANKYYIPADILAALRENFIDN